MKRTVTLEGSLRSECLFYGQTACEIIFYGNVSYQEEDFKNLPLLKLFIQGIRSGSEGNAVIVHDEYCRILPYLKHIQAFRHLLEQEVSHIWEIKEDGLLGSGLAKYLLDLKSFSESNAILKEAKTFVNKLKPNEEGIKIARKILESNGITPATDNVLEIIE